MKSGSAEKLCVFVLGGSTVGETMDREDATLLRQFAEGGSEEAFAALVERHLPMVYGAALRQLGGDSGLAAEVAQSVFITVARKARSLAPKCTLAPWLHRAVRLAALSAIRASDRRMRREREAMAMLEVEKETEVAAWESFRPIIDEALNELNEADREAILLTYFSGQTLTEVSGVFGCTENAVRMRVTRALEKLRKQLAKRGVTSTASAVSECLRNQPGTVLPAGLAMSITLASVSAAAITASHAGFLTFMTMTKTKVALTALIIGGVSVPFVMQRKAQQELWRENAALREKVTDLERSKGVETGPSLDAAELERLRAGQRELMRLRAEVTALRTENQDLKGKGDVRPTRAPTVERAEAPVAKGVYVPKELWTNVGSDTPEGAFQSFLAVLNEGDPAKIPAAAEFGVQWKENPTAEDQELVEKTKRDYFDMLKRAPNRLSAFRIEGTREITPELQEILFSTQTVDGKSHRSHFELVNVNGAWKPRINMHWFDGGGGKDSSFATSPVFGSYADFGSD